jgi:hypothetical protein
MAIEQEKYDKLKNNQLQFLNIENYEFIKMGFKIRFRSTLANKESKKKKIVTFVGIANYVNLGEKGNSGKFSNDKIKAKYSITLQEIFYLEDYHELLNQISSKFYVGGKSTWISNRELDSGLMLSKKY